MNSIKEIREKLNLSQVELAKLLGCNQSNLSRYENGKYEIPLLFIYRIKKICDKKKLKIDLTELINSIFNI